MDSVEHSPLLRAAFGPLAARTMTLIKAYPPLGDRLLRAPPGAFHIAVVAMLRRPSAEDAELARTIHDSSPTELLRRVWPDHHPDLPIVLRRAGTQARLLRFYVRLDALLRGPGRAALLAAREVSVTLPSLLDRALRRDPLVLSAMHLLRRYDELEALHALLVMLRSCGALLDDAAERAVLRDLRPGGLSNYVLRRLGRATIPVPTLPTTRRFRPVRSIRELHRLGREFGNCLKSNASYAFNLLARTHEIGVWEDDERAVVSVQRVADGLWVIDEAERQRGIPVDRATRATIAEELTTAGAVVLPVTPAVALHRLPLAQASVAAE